MSYDLNFCKSTNCTYDWDDFTEWCLQRSLNFRKSAPTQIWYENEATGVYFSFEQQGESAMEELRGSSQCADLTDLLFNINFLRPSFFGREAMPFVIAAAKQFGMLVSNPQEDGTPADPDTNALILNYVDHSARAAAAFLAQEGTSLTIMDAESSAAFFRHNSQHPRLVERYKNDYFVPHMMLCRRKSTNEILTFTTVSAGVFAIAPKTDMIVLTRERSRAFKKELELTFMPYEEFRSVMGDIVSEAPQPGMFVISEKKVDAAKKVIRALPFSRNHDFEGIRPDGVIDFVPGGDTSRVTTHKWDSPAEG